MTRHKLKFVTGVFALFITTCVFAQSNYDGEALTHFLGKDTASSQLKNLESNYHCTMINQDHYLSKEGLELFLKDGVLASINLYKSSPAYGSYAGRLPRGLSFGISSAQAKGLLGKPSVAYNTGYCEFDMHSYIITCWFEGDKLSQLGISAPAGH